MPPYDLAFTFVDTDGNTLEFGSFHHESPAANEYYDANWLHCRITLTARVESGTPLKVSVNGFFLCKELQTLAGIIRATLDSPISDSEIEFETLEPYINLTFSRDERWTLIVSRLDLRPAIGPVIELAMTCRDAEVRQTLEDLERMVEAFPAIGSPTDPNPVPQP
ncbi:MAG: hypothetical protein NVSMB31_15790 [Vulcanimicrobiaceae bacterium]